MYNVNKSKKVIDTNFSTVPLALFTFIKSLIPSPNSLYSFFLPFSSFLSFPPLLLPSLFFLTLSRSLRSYFRPPFYLSSMIPLPLPRSLRFPSRLPLFPPLHPPTFRSPLSTPTSRRPGSDARSWSSSSVGRGATRLSSASVPKPPSTLTSSRSRSSSLSAI